MKYAEGCTVGTYKILWFSLHQFVNTTSRYQISQTVKT